MSISSEDNEERGCLVVLFIIILLCTLAVYAIFTH